MACHVVALPYPGRGHVNSLMNLCKLLVSKKNDILVTFVVTEEWLGFIGSDPKPDNIRFASIPNVVPSELVRAADIESFLEATMTKMEAPFERVLGQLEPPPTVIVADTIVSFAVVVGNRKNIPVVSFWPMSASMFSTLLHIDLSAKNGDLPVQISEAGAERVDCIPGISFSRLVDDPLMDKSKQRMLQSMLKIISSVTNAQYLLFASIYELESQAIDDLKPEFSFPISSIGPTIPYIDLGENSFLGTDHSDLSYLEWLDCQPRSSVLYISMGSFLSVSSAQMVEIAAGLRDSGVRFLWVARDEASRLKDVCGDLGLLVPWCDQLRVLSHSSIGGFWTHCGWNSVQESVFSGVPFLTFPLGMDQHQNSRLIVEQWKIGWTLKHHLEADKLVTRGEIAELVKKFMDLDSDEMKAMRRRADEIKQICQLAIAEKGSSETNINSFVKYISECDAQVR
ncbi:UDP-glycosyltransferase 87A1 [Morella rubra]|uniref:UDP-glycosyltransferase 87A1 n=1 Tax=Morella rubra TaxID=262757 RepID=A0A6A1UPJ2_9ROSI|nr:UDP-glycosyltransferase 87A1 [Morella rubra]